jgi:hypothetical protein
LSKIKVSASISIDGFGAGPQPSLENPMGVGGEALGEWAFATRTFQRMHGDDWTFSAFTARTAERPGSTTTFSRGAS